MALVMVPLVAARLLVTVAFVVVRLPIVPVAVKRVPIVATVVDEVLSTV